MNFQEIHERIIGGDVEAMAAFQNEVAPLVIAHLVRKLGLTHEDAEEAWTDAFAVTIAQSPDLPIDGESLRRFTFKVARNKGVDIVRRRPGTAALSLDVDAIASNPVKPVAPADHVRVAALTECLAVAPERYRVVLELQHAHHTTTEIADQMRILPGSVYKIVERAKAWLRKCITGRLS